MRGARSHPEVCLLTVPVVSRVDPVELDLWRFTPAGLERLLRDELPEATIEVRGYGNLLAALATLLGVAVQELDARKLELHDRSRKASRFASACSAPPNEVASE
jgi:hypothetical protein